MWYGMSLLCSIVAAVDSSMTFVGIAFACLAIGYVFEEAVLRG